ncbi:hypothetical protein D3C87_2070330 [compost metagenome]
MLLMTLLEEKKKLVEQNSISKKTERLQVKVIVLIANNVSTFVQRELTSVTERN